MKGVERLFESLQLHCVFVSCSAVCQLLGMVDFFRQCSSWVVSSSKCICLPFVLNSSVSSTELVV